MAALNAALPGDVVLATEELELELLLEALFRRFGFDFRSHDRAFVRNRLLEFKQRQALATISQVQDRILHDTATRVALLRALSVRHSAMFDDPLHAHRTRAVLAQTLGSSALPRIWLPECAGAEDAWSVAILLADERLHGRTEIFATMSNEELLIEATRASVSTDRLAGYQENYLKSGGRANLADYFDIKGKRALLRDDLRERITWAQHNLVTDASFNEFQVIICRHVLADFNALLRRRTLDLFDASLARFGALGLDRTLADGDPLAPRYHPIFPHQSWYKRIA